MWSEIEIEKSPDNWFSKKNVTWAWEIGCDKFLWGNLSPKRFIYIFFAVDFVLVRSAIRCDAKSLVCKIKGKY